MAIWPLQKILRGREDSDASIEDEVLRECTQTSLSVPDEFADRFHDAECLCRWLEHEFRLVSEGWIVELGIEQVIVSSCLGTYRMFAVDFDQIESDTFCPPKVLLDHAEQVEMSPEHFNPCWLFFTDQHWGASLSVLSTGQIRRLCSRLKISWLGTTRRHEQIAAILCSVREFAVQIADKRDDGLAVVCRLLTVQSGSADLLQPFLKSRQTMITYIFHQFFGTEMASLLRIPESRGYLAQASDKQSIITFLTLTGGLLEPTVVSVLKRLPRDVLNKSVARMHPSRRSAIVPPADNDDPALVIVRSIHERCFELDGLSNMAVKGVHGCWEPFFVSEPTIERAEYIRRILICEYGQDVFDCISRARAVIDERNKSLRIARSVKRAEVIRDEQSEVRTRDHEWPQVVPKNTVHACLNDYVEAMTWTEPPVCAVCARSSPDLSYVEVGSDDSQFSKLKLHALYVVNPELARIMRVCGDADYWSYQSLDRIMLDPRGVLDGEEEMFSLELCTECLGSLKKGKVPRLALANGLYRGKLPDEFKDLTWIEEMICARSISTVTVARLDLGHGNHPGRILRGNTCTHEMNTISTAKALPRTPDNINGFISVVFLGPKLPNEKDLEDPFYVRRDKVWRFLLWLKENNDLYMDLALDPEIMRLYPAGGVMPGLMERIIHHEVSEEDAKKIYDEETAGIAGHPSNELHGKRADPSKQGVFIERTGVSDAELSTLPGRYSVSSALRNIVPAKVEKDKLPDLMIHRRGNPLGEYNNPSLFPGMYPVLFPYGIGGFEQQDRPTKLSFEAQARYFMDIADREFRYHKAFMFVVLNIIQRRTGHLYTSFTVSKGSFQQVADGLNGLSAKTLDKLATVIESEGSVRDLSDEEKTAMMLLRYVNTIATKVPGSAASKTLCRNEIRSYVGVMGVPQIFLTINPAPQHHPLFQLMVGDHTVDLSKRYPILVPGPERAERLANDPVAAADFFDKSIRCVFEHLFGWDYIKQQSSDRGGILGQLEGFYGTAEYTERGVLHGHFLLWLRGGMNPSEVHQRMKDDHDFQRRFFDFFEDVIKHELPNVDLPAGFNSETHKPAVEMPPAPLPRLEDGTTWAKETVSQWEDVFEAEVKLCGEALQRHPEKCHPICRKYGSKECRFRFPHEIVEASRFDAGTNSIYLLCRDGMVNYYNPYMLVYCRHNHDIKCILSGKSAKAAMFYITDYITKMSLKTGQLLSLMCKAVLTASKYNAEEDTPVESAKRVLHKCLAQFSSKQSIHAQQAARYLRGARDSMSSHKTIAVLSNLAYGYTKDLYNQCRIATSPAKNTGNDDVDPDEIVESDEDSSAGILLGEDYENDTQKGVEQHAFEEVEGSARRPSDDETDVERGSLVMKVGEDGRLIDSTQVHDYIYRDGMLSHLSFMDFVCMYTLEKKKDLKQPNRLGVKSRFELKDMHPLSKTHVIVERFVIDANAPRRIYTVPRVVGMSIPRSRQAEAYALFLFAHFVPFDCDRNPIRGGIDVCQFIAAYEFTVEDRAQINNWDVIYECEDARDADRLAQQEKLMREARGFRTACEGGTSDEGDGVVQIPANDSPETTPETVEHMTFFRTLQYSGYLGSTLIKNQIFLRDECPVQHEPWMSIELRKWETEIKRHQKNIASDVDRLLHTEDQMRQNSTYDEISPSVASPTELGNGCSLTLIDADEIPCNGNEKEKGRAEFPKYIPILKTKVGTVDDVTVEERPSQVMQRISQQHGLNEKQNMAFEIAADSWMKVFTNRMMRETYTTKTQPKEEPLRLLMTGPGGTGKSHSIKALKDFMEVYGSGHRLRLLAPTGSAAALIGGMTCHKGLSLRVKEKSDRGGKTQRTTMDEVYDKSDSVKKKAEMRRSWMNIDVVLIDEVSLLSLVNLADIDYALRMAKEKPNEWFGGIIVIFSGDFCQYPPVGGNALYSCMRSNRELTDRELKRRLGRLAWKTLNAVIEFEEQFRMKDDPEYGRAVVRLRERRCTQSDVDLFNSRVIKSSNNRKGPNMSEGDNGTAVMIVARNDIREEVNGYKAETESIPGSAKRLFRCGALDYIDDELVPNLDHAKCRDKALALKTAPFSADGALPGILPLVEGMPVILRGKNIAVELRIANGSQGYVYKLETAVDKYGVMYAKLALVYFPDSPVHLSGLPLGVFPIKPATWNFSAILEIECGNPLRYKIRRYQLPIQPGFAVTGQSAQGKTMPKVSCKMTDGPFAAYVAVSRARRREDLYLLEPVTLKDLNKKRGLDLESEIRRYKVMEINTLIRFGFRSGTLLPVPDAEDRHFEPQSRMYTSSSNAVIWGKIAPASSPEAVIPVICPPISKSGTTPTERVTRASSTTKMQAVGTSDHKGHKKRADLCEDASVYLKNTVPTTEQTVEALGSVAQVQAPEISSSRCSRKRKRAVDAWDVLPVSKYRKINFETIAGCRWLKTWSCAYDCTFMALYSMFGSASTNWRVCWAMSTPCTSSLAAKFDRLLLVKKTAEEGTLLNEMRNEFRTYMAKIDSAAFPRDTPKAVSIWELFSVVLRWTRRTLQLVPRQGYISSGATQNLLQRDGLQQDLYDRRDSNLSPCERHTHQCWVNSACTLDQELIWRPKHGEDCNNEDSTPFVLNDPPFILALSHTPTMGDNVFPVKKLRVPCRTAKVQYQLSCIVYWGGNHFTARIFENGRTYKYDGMKFLGDCVREYGSDIKQLTESDMGRFSEMDGRGAYMFIYRRG